VLLQRPIRGRFTILLKIHVLLFFAYNDRAVPARTCVVSFTDSEGISHGTEVSASSLYEAAALGLAELKRCGVMPVEPGPATRLTVVVKSPTTKHELTMEKLKSWLTGGAKSPNEAVTKSRLREIVGIGERTR